MISAAIVIQVPACSHGPSPPSLATAFPPSSFSSSACVCLLYRPPSLSPSFTRLLTTLSFRERVLHGRRATLRPSLIPSSNSHHPARDTSRAIAVLTLTHHLLLWGPHLSTTLPAPLLPLSRITTIHPPAPRRWRVQVQVGLRRPQRPAVCTLHHSLVRFTKPSTDTPSGGGDARRGPSPLTAMGCSIAAIAVCGPSHHAFMPLRMVW